VKTGCYFTNAVLCRLKLRWQVVINQGLTHICAVPQIALLTAAIRLAGDTGGQWRAIHRNQIFYRMEQKLQWRSVTVPMGPAILLLAADLHCRPPLDRKEDDPQSDAPERKMKKPLKVPRVAGKRANHRQKCPLDKSVYYATIGTCTQFPRTIGIGSTLAPKFRGRRLRVTYSTNRQLTKPRDVMRSSGLFLLQSKEPLP